MLKQLRVSDFEKMMKEIAFKNYKIFKEKQILELKPITILIGKNNSGKSAVSKLPTLIEGTLNTKETEALNFINNGVELGGEFRDLVYGRATRMMEFELLALNKDNNRNNKLSIGDLV